MPDAVETVWQDVDQEPADELRRGQAEDLLPIATFDPVVLPAECHGVGISADQAVVGDGDAVGVAGQVCQYGLWPAKWWFGVRGHAA